MLHILCTRSFFFVLVYNDNNKNLPPSCNIFINFYPQVLSNANPLMPTGRRFALQTGDIPNFLAIEKIINVKNIFVSTSFSQFRANNVQVTCNSTHCSQYYIEIRTALPAFIKFFCTNILFGFRWLFGSTLVITLQESNTGKSYCNRTGAVRRALNHSYTNTA